MPTILLEAMICRVPVIATPVVGVPEIIEHRQAGMLVPARGSVALANAIEDILNPTTDFVSDVVYRAENAAKNMTWETTARQMIGQYQDAWPRTLAPNTGAPCEVSAHEPQRRTA